jgi:uncharacterized lipoprotein YajG
MKKIIPLFFILLLAGCAAQQNVQQPTLLMNSEAKIQYYQEQIDHYTFLIEQEKKKAEASKTK